MIDTHAHLHSRAFDSDRAEVLAKIWDAGLRFVLEINIDRAGWPKVRALSESDPRIFVTVGVHPMDVGEATHEDLDRLEPEIAHPRVLAIGETGIDYYRDYSPYDKQREFFRRHVAWARAHRKPLVIHSRCRKDGPSSHEDVLAILEGVGGGEVRGVLHCFSGDVEIARRGAALGLKLGMGGAISYGRKKNRKWVAEIAEAVGPDAFVLETDCPYLTPHPHQEKRNDPSYVPQIAGYLADYLGMSLEEVAERTDAAAEELFGFSRAPKVADGARESGAAREGSESTP